MGKKWNFSVMNIFSLVMAATFIGLGIYILVSPKFATYPPEEVKVIFAVFFMLYGIFRFVRIYPKLRNNKYY